jgi:beta-xylosidase
LTPVRVSVRILAVLATLTAPTLAQASRSGNPILAGWYADPEAHVFDGRYWIFPTYSAPYDQQTFLDAFSSRDLVTWVKHSHVLDVADVSWAKRAVWAPSIVEKDGWYYLFFAANDIQNDQQVGGIGVARSRSPEGPFRTSSASRSSTGSTTARSPSIKWCSRIATAPTTSSTAAGGTATSRS